MDFTAGTSPSLPSTNFSDLVDIAFAAAAARVMLPCTGVRAAAE